MTRRQMQTTERCGSCRRPVAVTRFTTRSRYGDKPLCDACGSAPREQAFESRRSSTATGDAVRWIGEVVRARKWADMDERLAVWRAPEVRAYNTAALGGAPRWELDELAEAVDERFPWIGEEMRRRYPRTETREVDYDRYETRERDFADYETRDCVFDEDRGRYVFHDREPNGQPVPGRAYSSRWWR